MKAPIDASAKCGGHYYKWIGSHLFIWDGYAMKWVPCLKTKLKFEPIKSPS